MFGVEGFHIHSLFRGAFYPRAINPSNLLPCACRLRIGHSRRLRECR
jgi:hypothetical protein